MLAAWWLLASRIGVLSLQADAIGSYAVIMTTTPEGWLLLVRNLFLRLPFALGVYNLPLLAAGALHLALNRDFANRLTMAWIAAVFIPLLLTRPEPRFFLPCLPALALMMARGLKLAQGEPWRVVALALIYCLFDLARGV